MAPIEAGLRESFPIGGYRPLATYRESYSTFVVASGAPIYLANASVESFTDYVANETKVEVAAKGAHLRATGKGMLEVGVEDMINDRWHLTEPNNDLK